MKKLTPEQQQVWNQLNMSPRLRWLLDEIRANPDRYTPDPNSKSILEQIRKNNRN